MSTMQKIIKSIAEATGRTVKVSLCEDKENLQPQIYEDGGKVCFSFVYEQRDYCGEFDKTSDEDEAFARLFISMLENSSAEDFESLEPEEKVRLLLLGELSSSKAVAVKRMLKNFIYDHYAVFLTAESKAKRIELEGFVETMKESGDFLVTLGDEEIAYFKVKTSGYESPLDFAKILFDSIKEELRIDMYVSVVGTVTDFDELCLSYKKAKTALYYGKMLHPNERVYYFKEFALASVLEKIPQSELANLYTTLIGDVDESVWKDDELISTAEAFIRCSLNVSETGRYMYIHRNTLMYRLDKIKRETGYDLRSFSDACAFKLLHTIRKILLYGKSEL